MSKLRSGWYHYGNSNGNLSHWLLVEETKSGILVGWYCTVTASRNWLLPIEDSTIPKLLAEGWWEPGKGSTPLCKACAEHSCLEEAVERLLK